MLFGESDGNGKTQTYTAMAVQVIGANLPKGLEGEQHFAWRHSWTSIRNRYRHAALDVALGRHHNPSSVGRKLLRVGEQINENLADAPAINIERQDVSTELDLQILPFGINPLSHKDHTSLHELAQIVTFEHRFGRSALNFRNVEDIGNDLEEMTARVRNVYGILNIL